MLKTEKQEILSQIMVLLSELVETNDNTLSPETTEPKKQKKVELLTIKEATQLISGLSEHTLRKYIRTGQGRHGKILIYKENLINYFVTPA